MAKRDEDKTEPVKMERIGEKEFTVEHDDGSIFEVEADSRERADNIGTGLKRVSGKPPTPKRYFSGLNFDKNGKIIREKDES